MDNRNDVNLAANIDFALRKLQQRSDNADAAKAAYALALAQREKAETELFSAYRALDARLQEIGQAPLPAEPILKLPNGRLIQLDPDGGICEIGALTELPL